MKAQLSDGRIIELNDTCEYGCITHVGPHWLHMDRYEYRNNAKLLDMAEELSATARTHTDFAMVHVLLDRFAELESVRLGNTRREMERRGIVGLIEDSEA